VEGRRRLPQPPAHPLSLPEVVALGKVQVTAAALQELCSQDVGVSFFTAGGWYYGTLAPHSGVNVQTRIAQFRLASSPSGSLPIARAFVMGKIQNCRTLLRRNARGKPHLALGQLKRLAQEAERAQSHESLLGVAI
jgi:CRISPR-associated protein Cas1